MSDAHALPRRTARVGGAGLLALVATYGIGRQAYGLFVPTFREEFGLSLDVLGLYASVAQAGYFVTTLLTGILAARLGARVPVVSGCLLLSVGAALTAAAPGPVLLAIGIAAAGTSAGGTWAPFSDAVDDLVPAAGRRRALALVNAGAPIGLVVASCLVLVSGDHWRVAWWAFAAVGVAAAAAAWTTLPPGRTDPARDEARPTLRWVLNRRSAPLFAVTVAAGVTSGAYFAYAPDTVQDAGLGSWSGPAMWVCLGVAGAAVGVAGGDLADRWDLRRPLALMLVLLGISTLALLVAPGAPVVALGSAAVFGVGFTTAFALLAIWNQRVFHDRPTTGFTVVIACSAIGFVVGPGLFGVLATSVDRSTALVVAALPALLVTLVRPPRDESSATPTDRSTTRVRR